MEEDRIVDCIIIVGYLTIIFLRIFNVIQWSWWWILCPFWLLAGGALIGIILGLMIGIPWRIYLNIKEKMNK